MRPEDSTCPNYPNEEHDKYMLFSMFGEANNPFAEKTKIYNKDGSAYGYLTENAYILDEENGIEFFLTATVHVNENQIFNDDNYEYDEIGLPYLANLGQVIYEYEKSKK